RAPGLSARGRRPRRRHYGHGVEASCRRHRGGGRASSGEGAGGEGGEGSGEAAALRPVCSGAAAATLRRGCPWSLEQRRLPPELERGMPAPEQASLVEEGQPQTHQEAVSTGPGMEPETTATTILASVKEQLN
uniref:Plakophilin 4 n=1 Tax=Mus spicilegus TaxID=10103 RepID=A0A8C6GA37_MUSSI